VGHVKKADGRLERWDEGYKGARNQIESIGMGRFPANLVLSCCGSDPHEDDCAVKALDGQSGVSKPKTARTGKRGGSPIHGSPTIGTPDKEGHWPEDLGGGASRFFYCAKISKSERNAGLDGEPDRTLAISGGAAAARGETEYTGAVNPSGYDRIRTVKNNHPTVKPQKLMRYLCKMITPPQGVVLDPFMGSGSTGIAAKREGFRFIGIERDPDYFRIAEARINGVPSAELEAV
jgi:site-specific DNA-methyltransferase (adenine-specific)